MLNNYNTSLNEKAYLSSRVCRASQIKYEFGYFPTDDNLTDLFSFVSKEELEESSLLYMKASSNGMYLHGVLSNHNLIFPLKDAHGHITGILGRSIESKEKLAEKDYQKYKYTFGYSKELFCFNLDNARKAILEKGYVICVEGQLDAIALDACGIHNVVAIGGSSISQYQMFQLLKFTDKILLMLDSDDAGRSGTKKAMNRFKKYADIKNIKIPKDYKDIDELLRGSDAGLKRIVVDKLKDFYEEQEPT